MGIMLVGAMVVLVYLFIILPAVCQKRQAWHFAGSAACVCLCLYAAVPGTPMALLHLLLQAVPLFPLYTGVWRAVNVLRCCEAARGAPSNKLTKKKVAKKTWNLFVRDLAAKTVTVQMAANNTVFDLKQAIYAKTNVPAKLQNLLFSTAKFAAAPDDALLADCNIGCGSTLIMTLAGGIRGGMGCGPSKPSGGDDGEGGGGGAAYREEVTVYDAGNSSDAAAGKGKKQKKEQAVSTKVAKAIAAIQAQMVELQRVVDEHGAVASPELEAVAARQAADAVGSTLTVIKSLEHQLREAGEVAEMNELEGRVLNPLKHDLKVAQATLEAAMDVCTKTWKLTIEEPFQAAVDDEATFAALPMSAEHPNGSSMISIIGTIALKGGVTFESVTFKYEGSWARTTMDVAVSAVPEWMFASFAKKRVGDSTTLVQMILKDVDLYEKELARQITLPGGAAAVAALAEASSSDSILDQAVVGNSGSTGIVTKAWIMVTAAAAIATAAATDVALDSLAYVAHARLSAAPVSILLYEVVSGLLFSHNIDSSECLPGMVKGAPRIVFKSMTKYGGNTSKCHDLARATVSVGTLADIVAVLLAVLACPMLVVIRIKNRMDPAYDATSIGGYRDVQLQCLLQDAAGNWHYVELQINLVAMIAIKEGGGEGGGGGGGHHAFDQARLIDAFSERTLRYNGQPSDVVFGMVRSGVLLALDLTNNTLDESQQASLQSALASDECRIRSLVLNNCDLGAAFGDALAEMFASGHLKLTVLG